MQVGLDLCTVGTPLLLWTPWEPSEVSCTERYPHCRAKFTHIWDIDKCPYFRVSFTRGSTVVIPLLKFFG